jgi:hypothetical protein
MVKAIDNGTVNTAQALVSYGTQNIEREFDETEITKLAAGALERLRRDLESYHPTKPAIAYALAGETHKVTVRKWRQNHPPAVQSALLSALLDEAAVLLRQLQTQIAKIVPSNGYMFGMQDEAIKLETQADITLEEIHRLEADLRALDMGEVVQ